MTEILRLLGWLVVGVFALCVAAVAAVLLLGWALCLAVAAVAAAVIPDERSRP